MKEKIGLIQIDGTMPNLALMKLSAFYKQKGFEVVFIGLCCRRLKCCISPRSVAKVGGVMNE